MTHMIGTFAAAAQGGADIPPEVKLVRTTGYAAEGDGGGALYAEAEAMPATQARFQDLYFRWFGLAPGQAVRPEPFGAAAAGGDDTQAVRAALAFAAAAGGTVALSRIYAVSSEIEVPPGVAVTGPRSSGFRRIDEARTTTTEDIAAGTGSRSFAVADPAGFAVGQSVMLVSGSGYSPSDPYSHRNPVITAVQGSRITIAAHTPLGHHPAGAVLQTASHGLILLGGNRIEGFTIDGNGAMQTDAVWRTTTELVIEGSGCTVRDVAIVGGASDLVLVAGSARVGDPPPAGYVENSRFIGCDFDEGGANGIHLSFTTGTLVEGCRFRRLNRRASGINAERQEGGVICSSSNRDVTVTGCDFEEMYDAVGAIDAQSVGGADMFSDGFTVAGNRMHNCHRPLRVLNRGGGVVFAGNRVSADYPFAGGLTDSRVYLFGAGYADRARRVQVSGNAFTNVRIESALAEDLAIAGNSFDLTALSAAGAFHPITLSVNSRVTVAGNLVRGGAYGIRLMNFGGAADAAGIVVEGNVFTGQRWTGIHGDFDAPGPIGALIRGNWIASEAASAIGPDYRAIRMKPGMYAEANVIALEAGSAWDLSQAGPGPSRGANLVDGAVEDDGNFAEVAASAVTLGPGDAGGYRRIVASGPASVTVPAAASVAFPVGTEIRIEQGGEGAVTLAGAPGVTVGSLGGARTTAGRHAVARLVKHGPDAWTASGDLVA